MSSSHKVFNKTYSRYYDLLYADKKYNLEVDALTKLIKQYETKPSSTIFEIGSGSGKHAIELLKHNYQLTGIDLSSSMVELASAHTAFLQNENVQFLTANICNKDLVRKISKKFDVAISMFHVISYITNNNDLISAFANTNELLEQNGLFIFDCWYGPGVLSDKPSNRTKIVENKTTLVKRDTVSQLHENENMVVVNFTIHVNDKLTNENSVIEEKHLMRYFFTPEMELLAKQTGFKIIAQQAFPNIDKPPSCNTWYTSYVLQKIN